MLSSIDKLFRELTLNKLCPFSEMLFEKSILRIAELGITETFDAEAAAIEPMPPMKIKKISPRAIKQPNSEPSKIFQKLFIVILIFLIS